ncbi:MAG: zf-TFIIB domain-containing protein [Polyangiaceae bacterium]|nr:zf-TFIIB domain-containing protein [Polyangiaceae bacterium]
MQSPGLFCPRCQTLLVVKTTPSGALHGCNRCGGVWVDRETGQRVARSLCEHTLSATEALGGGQLGAASADPHQLSGVRCPVCLVPLSIERVTRANVEIDVCANHGSWFDRDELRRVARGLAAERAYGGAALGGAGALVLATEGPALDERGHRIAEAGELALDTAAVAGEGLVGVGEVLEGASIAGDLASGAFELLGELLGGLG